ncbi:MAG: D-alanyl-D-alanine carboxypeptidase family protein [Alphaproteobacteria bacterium]|nr:D-alanyl-D-alanine carboxypeptidase family protein [Alphaproteobacteria bacterium]
MRMQAQVTSRKLGFLQKLLMAVVAAGIFMSAPVSPSYAGITKYNGQHSKAKKKTRTAKGKSKPQPDRYGSIVIDAQSGYVLSEKNPDKKLFPASLTKMMTLYLTFEAIEKGTLTKYQRIPVSANAQYQPPSKLGLEAGYSIRVEDGILALVTRSANDAAVVLGEAVGGSQSRFARLMTFKAQQLGMRNTRFANASGLHDPEQYSTPRDMAILSQALMRDFPRYYRYFSTPSFTYNGLTSLNHNKLMATYPGMDGLKTGYVYASGYNLAASAVQGNKRLIGVVFGGRTSASRNSTMRDLLDAGFERMKDPRVLAAIDKRLEAARGGMPKRKPATPTAKNEPTRMQPRTARTQTNLDAPSFSPMGMSTEEGDAQEQTAAQLVAATQTEMPAGAAPRNAFHEARPGNAVTGAPNSLGGAALAPMTAHLTAPLPRKSPAAQAPAQKQVLASKPAPLRQPAATAAPVTTASAAGGSWAIQIGAFADQNAGMTALKSAHQKLPTALTSKTRYIIAPLQTNKGVIYRARLSGLQQSEANSACKLLQGACIVMAVQ